MVDHHYFCAICQKPSIRIVCLDCEACWDQDADWVKMLKQLERQQRAAEAQEYFCAPIHIAMDGELWNKLHHHLARNYLDQHYDQVEAHLNDMIIHGIELWADMGGLTLIEHHALEMARLGMVGEDAVEEIDVLEHKHVTATAHHRRVQRLIEKLRKAVRSNEIDTDDITFSQG